MEEFYRFANRLGEAFEAEGLDYAFTGALAVSVYGSPRTTSDVDIMVAVGRKADVKAKVSEALRRAGVQVDDRKIDEALTSGYNIATFADRASAYTVDLIFTKGRLDKQAGKLAGVATFFQTPEGLVLAKLRMIKATLPRKRAAKDEEDVKAVLTFTKVDLEAVKKRAKAEKTLEILEALIE
jgi:hypothetical protein